MLDNNKFSNAMLTTNEKFEKDYRKSGVGLIPKEWNYKKLSKLFSNIRNGFVGTATPYYVENGIKYLQGKNIKNGKIISDGLIYVSREFHEKQKKSQLKTNDIVMVQSGHVGECAVVNEEYSGSNCHALIILTPSENVNSTYYSYLFNSNIGQRLFYRVTTGNTVKHILASDLKSLKVPVPTIEEQRKISNILSTWDKAIELIEKLIEHKKEQKKGLMQKLLTGEVRLPGFDGEWKAEKIKNISKVYRGASPRPISDSRWFDQDSKIGWVRISDVTNSKKILYKTEQYLSEEGIKKSRLVKKNSIIMSICATVGKPIITGFDVCIHDGFVVFEDVKINKDYFYYSLLRIENYWIKYGQTGSQMNLNTDIVGNEKIKFPVEYAEQKAIAELLMNVDKEIDLLESELEQLKLQKQGLMQLLLTGKVRVKV